MNDDFEQLSTHSLQLGATCLALGFKLVATEPTKAVKPLGRFYFRVPVGFERRYWAGEVTVEPRLYYNALAKARRIVDEAIARGYAAPATGNEGQWTPRRPSHRESRL